MHTRMLLLYAVTQSKRVRYIPYAYGKNTLMVQNIATRMLNFIRRNLCNCSKEIKSRAYLTLVCPILEYASPIWDPHLVKDRDQIEKVQRAAACSLGIIRLSLVK